MKNSSFALVATIGFLSAAMAIGWLVGAGAQQSVDTVCLEQDSGGPAKGLVTGSEYVALDFWDKLKLSNTYFTSPQTIKSLDIVYEFGYGEFSPSNISAIVVAAKNKQLAFAIPDSNSAGEKAAFKIADLQSVRDSFGLKNYDELLSCMQKNKISIVSFSPQLLEQPSVEILGDVREFGTSRQR
ncbi:MAG: hypothetical protein ABR929_02190 [Roseiarcus sp.]|jgi:hypothetical protein